MNAATLLLIEPPLRARRCPTRRRPRLGRARRRDARLLVVFLRGGYDAANLLVPTGSDFYYESRPNIAIAAARTRPTRRRRWRSTPTGACIRRCATRSCRCYAEGPGRLRALRRHRRPDAQPFRDPGHDRARARRVGAARDYHSGFMNRLAARARRGRAPIAFTDQLPLIFRGGAQVPNIALNGVGKPGIDARQAAADRRDVPATRALAAPVARRLPRARRRSTQSISARCRPGQPQRGHRRRASSWRRGASAG